MLFSVDNDGGDLLIHEQQDGQEQGGDGGRDVDVPRRPLHDERNNPASNIGPRGLIKHMIRFFIFICTLIFISEKYSDIWF
jgi:hypothetical protein